MFKIEGLDKIQKELKEIQNVMKLLDGELGEVSFNPNDPGSIELAIQTIHNVIDDRIGQYGANSMVESVIEQVKEEYRSAILQEAAEARLKADEEE